MVHTSHSEQETQALGERFGRRLRGGEIVLLCGDLGVGKTQFAKGIGRALAVRGEVVSPTFTLAVHYDARIPLVHYDLYRVSDDRELAEIGFLDCEDPATVCLVEWGDRVDAPRNAIRIDMYMEPDGSRRIEIHAFEPGEAT